MEASGGAVRAPEGWFCKDGSCCRPRARRARPRRRMAARRVEPEDPPPARAGLSRRQRAGPVRARLRPVADDSFQVYAFLVEVPDRGRRRLIFRRAQYYRGALRDRTARGRSPDAARHAGRPEWIGYRYPALRVGARLLPHGKDVASVQKIRELAATLAGLDPTFEPLRAKIHGTPDVADAAQVRAFALRSRPELGPRFEELATEIEKVYAGGPLAEHIEQVAGVLTRAPALQQALRDAARAFGPLRGRTLLHVRCGAGRLDASQIETRALACVLDLSLATRLGLQGRHRGEERPAMTRAERLAWRSRRCRLWHRPGERPPPRRAEGHALQLTGDRSSLADASSPGLSFAPGWGAGPALLGRVDKNGVGPWPISSSRTSSGAVPALLLSGRRRALRDANRVAACTTSSLGRRSASASTP